MNWDGDPLKGRKDKSDMDVCPKNKVGSVWQNKSVIGGGRQTQGQKSRSTFNVSDLTGLEVGLRIAAWC